MKTTVELPPELLRRVKAEAALQGRTMKELLVEALREKLAKDSSTRGGWRAVFGKGRASELKDVELRLRDLERVDPASWE
jgi:hypothetical protein